MKKIMLMLAAVAMIAGGMQSCKKGENDAFLSLRSRKARMAGEWTMSNLSETSTTTTGSSSTVSTTTFSGSDLTITDVSGGVTTTTTGTINAATINILKDGTWTRTMDFSVPFEVGGILVATMQSVETASGTWNFLGKVDSYKNKERFVMNLLSSTTVNTTTPVTGAATSETTSTTYADGESSEVMALDQLKNKEIIMVADGNSVETPDTGDATTTTSTTSITLTRD